jgi:hypothetical protein
MSFERHQPECPITGLGVAEVPDPRWVYAVVIRMLLTSRAECGSKPN